MTQIFKDSRNRWITEGLFIERAELRDREYDPAPHLSISGREGYIDARKTFLALRDPTGYKWANQYIGGYPHFKRLITAPWFVDVYNEWIEELNMLMRQEAIDEIKKISKDAEVSDSQRLAASKYLANREWEKADRVPASKRGRPTKEEVRGALKESIQMSEETRDEFLRVVEGGKA